MEKTGTLPPVALVGLGGMGAAIGHRLLDKGCALTVFNRTAAKAAPLAAAGAAVAADAESCLSAARTVLISLSDEQAVAEVLLDRVALVPTGTLVIDTSTVSPTFARAAAGRLAAAGVRRLEACVVGNPFQARNGELRVLVAGDPADLEQARPVLDVLAAAVIPLGRPGNASVMKLVFNLLLGAQVAGLAEAVSYGTAAGLDRDFLLRAIGGSGFSSRVLSFRAELMAERRYAPAAFRSALMYKDLALGIQEARAAGVELPVLGRVAERFAAMVDGGDGDLDAAAVIELQQRDLGGPGETRT